jgi:hypothetical protein
LPAGELFDNSKAGWARTFHDEGQHLLTGRPYEHEATPDRVSAHTPWTAGRRGTKRLVELLTCEVGSTRHRGVLRECPVRTLLPEEQVAIGRRAAARSPSSRRAVAIS